LGKSVFLLDSNYSFVDCFVADLDLSDAMPLLCDVGSLVNLLLLWLLVVKVATE
jgi:hypothetical protein